MQRINSGWIVVVLIIAAVAAAVLAILQLDTTGEQGSGLSEEYAYDLSQLAKIDPNLILYAESGPAIHTGLSQSRAIALDPAGRMYVAGDKAIRVFGGTGNLESTIELAGEPQCLTISDDGTIYVGMRDHVEVLDAQGKVVASWEPLGDEAVLTSIARHKDDVFVADAGHRIVLHYDAAGTLVGHIGEKDPDASIPGFFIPSPHFDLAVSRDGLLRVADPGRNRIETFTARRRPRILVGRALGRHQGLLRVLQSGEFRPVARWRLRHRREGPGPGEGLQQRRSFCGRGRRTRPVAGGKQMKVCETPEECQGTALDVAAGADGRIYVLDPTDNTIRMFRRKGADR